MIVIKSLTKITEVDDSVDTRHKSDLAKVDADIAKANSDFDSKTGGSSIIPRQLRANLNPFGKISNKDYGAAKYDRSSAIDAAEEKRKAADERHEAGHKGLITKRDHDEEVINTKISLAAKARAAAKASKNNVDVSPVPVAVEHPGLLSRLGSHLAEHPLHYAAAAAGIAGAIALQKRKNRLPEPGRY